jgi:hypothetical protein
MQRLAPEQYEDEKTHQLDLDSAPVVPTTRDAGTDAPPIALSDVRDIKRAVAVLSVELSDQAPRSSSTRACALASTSRLATADFLGILREAALLTRSRINSIQRRAPDGRVNAMPYLFATFERLLRHSTPRSEASGSPERDVSTIPISGTGREPSCAPSGPPLWQDLLRHLQAVLAPPVAIRLAATRVDDMTCDRLCLAASSAAEAAWLDRVLRHRIEEALADLGHSGLAVSITVAHASLDHLLPATAT